jgi:glycosyltransferase involved in cell wall biosynthesis
MVFGAFILTFRRPDDLRHSIKFLLAQTRRPDQIWVIDNANDPAARAVVAEFVDDEIIYHATEENLGSAGGVAEGFGLLAAAGCDWIMTVDDDDVPWLPETFVLVERLIEMIERNTGDAAGPSSKLPLGIVGATGARFDWATGEHRRIPTSELVGDVDVDIVAGGSFHTMSRKLIEDLGPARREYFFGHWDPLWCLEAKTNGYRVLVSGDLMRLFRDITGRLEIQPVRRTMVSGWPYHSLWRRYYVTRNYIFAMRSIFGTPRLARRMAAKGLVQSVFAFGRGPRYGLTFATMQIRGIVDGYRGRLGPTIPPVLKPERFHPADELSEPVGSSS